MIRCVTCHSTNLLVIQAKASTNPLSKLVFSSSADDAAAHGVESSTCIAVCAFTEANGMSLTITENNSVPKQLV